MLHLLRAEIRYNRPVFWYIFVCALLAFLSLHFWRAMFGTTPGNANVGYLFVVYFYFYFVMAILTTPWGKEKRVRQLILLPVSPFQIGMANMLLFFSYWSFLFGLFIIWILISQFFSLATPTIISIVTMTGMAFTVRACIVLLGQYPDTKWRKISEGLVILIIGFLAMAGVVHIFQQEADSGWFDRILSWMCQSPAGAGAWLLLGIGLSIWTLFYPRLESYAE